MRGVVPILVQHDFSSMCCMAMWLMSWDGQEVTTQGEGIILAQKLEVVQHEELSL